jgi:thioredoxin reductase (NADPH)
MLTHLHCDTTVMVRGPLLRGFDQQMAEKVRRPCHTGGGEGGGVELRFYHTAPSVPQIGEHMAATGTRILRGALPIRLDRTDADSGAAGAGTPARGSRVAVTFEVVEADASGKPVTVHRTEVFDTVVFATGRAPDTRGLGLDKAGVLLDGGGKIVGSGGGGGASPATTGGSLQGDDKAAPSPDSETSSVPSIHAVGDVLAGRPELTPVAIKAGRLLARRIMRGGAGGGGAAAAAALAMDYRHIPTTVFTPLEYGCVGLSEEEAQRRYGRDGYDVYHLAYDTLELSVAHRMDTTGMPMPPHCYTKLITTRGATPEQERVLGLHVLGPNAGEVIQGFAVALRMGATRAHLEATIGIHPTHAEEVVTLDRTKASGEPFVKTSC